MNYFSMDALATVSKSICLSREEITILSKPILEWSQSDNELPAGQFLKFGNLRGREIFLTSL